MNETVNCKDCGKPFEITEGWKQLAQEKGLSLPKRCKKCRQAKRERNERMNGNRNGDHSQGGYQEPRQENRYPGDDQY